MLPQPNDTSSDAPRISASGSPEFTAQERAQLLQLAHASIGAALQGAEIPLEPPSAHLAEFRGVFTTLYLHKELRGCVGYVFPVMPVYQAVAETARAAAFDDTRFYPLTQAEAPELRISLSVLSPLQPIRPEEIELGRHGLMISLHRYRGLLLPQVPVEHQWDRITFLQQTCRKAGLPLDAWEQGASIEAFTTEVFSDKDLDQ
ncbi:MAG TPA: AmmeMemoRadiSam system protein A [Terriglobales bacterium]|nr:AmmeMemoRadiSam system protein A [Terriglobales bacterium]